MVRLEALSCSGVSNNVSDFNSCMVRLEEEKIQPLPPPFIIFQFLYGTIGSRWPVDYL